MSRRTSALWVSLALLGALSAATLRAQMVNYYWSGQGTNNFWATPANWQGGTTPVNDIVNTRVFFSGTTFKNNIGVSGLYLKTNQLSISGNTPGYFFGGGESILAIGSGGLLYTPTQQARSEIRPDLVKLSANQTWNIQNGRLFIGGYLEDYDVQTDTDTPFKLTKTGAGTLILGANYSSGWSGGMQFDAGQVVIGPDSDINGALPTDSLGSGTLTFNGGTLVADSFTFSEEDTAVILSNPVVVNGLLATENRNELRLQGTVTLTADTTIQTQGEFLWLQNGVTGAGRKLTINSNGTVILDSAFSEASNDYSGGTLVTKGALVFADASAVPNTGLIAVASAGYVGFGTDASMQTEFFDKLNRAAVFGTIGFDSDPDGTGTTTITVPIDLGDPDGAGPLVAFPSGARLGSVTKAIISGTITPQGSAYHFGGGGGVLRVDSALTGGRTLTLDSEPERNLTLRLTNAGNNFTGGTTITNSAVVFATGAMPAGAATIAVSTGAYVGTEDSDIAGFLNRVSPTSGGAIGFDVNGSYRQIAGAIDLSSFSGSLYLGTTTPLYTSAGPFPGLKLTGTITTTNGGVAPYRFAAYKSGWLEVASNLTGSAGVAVGDPTSPSTFADILRKEYSTVVLSGDNPALTGEISLFGGRLEVGQSNGTVGTNPTSALGTGSLVVYGFPWGNFDFGFDGEPPPPSVTAAFDGMLVSNPISLNSSLALNGPNDFALSGVVSGPGSLSIGPADNDLTLTLSNANTFSGGIKVEGEYSTVNFLGDTSSGAGPLDFGGSGGNARFASQNPVVAGIFSNSTSEIELLFTNSARLTINQNFDSSYSGNLRADNGTSVGMDGVFVKTGTGTLRLQNTDIYAYGQGASKDVLEVQQGTLVLSDVYFESSLVAVRINGGKLVLEGGGSFSNPILFGAGGGVLGGNGVISTPITAGSLVTLAPGDSPGNLTFSSGLTLAPGGTYDWEIQAVAGTAGASWDLISVSGGLLDLSALGTGGYTLKLRSLQPDSTPGLLSGFDPSVGYSWTIFNYTAINPTVFNPATFVIDTSQFANSLSYNSQGNGAFFLSQSGSQLLLNFAPVPEPSTYALMILGLGTVLFPALRRRRK